VSVFSGFFVGSANYNSRIQMVPEFAGGAPVTSEPGHIDFRIRSSSPSSLQDLCVVAVAGASIEIERHAHRHSHGFLYPPVAPPLIGASACPGTTPAVEQFGGESISTESACHRFNVTAVVPVGNGIASRWADSIRPLGYERHDAALNLTATTSELQRFGRPQTMTGATVAVQPTPWLTSPPGW